MDPEEKKLLKETFELAKENNKLLHKVRGVQKREAVWWAIKMLIGLGLALGTFYYVQPYVEKIMETYTSFSSPDFIKNFGR